MKKLLSFILGLLIPSLLYLAGAYLLFELTFTLSSETLSQHENVITLFFFCVLSGVILFSFLSFRQFKAGKKYTSYGIALSVIPILLVLIKIGIVYFNQLNYYEEFDKVQWAKSDNKPFNMAKTLSKKDILLGLHRKEVINKLGYFRETARVDGTTLVYFTEKSWLLYVDLKNDSVVKAYLYSPGLD